MAARNWYWAPLFVILLVTACTATDEASGSDGRPTSARIATAAEAVVELPDGRTAELVAGTGNAAVDDSDPPAIDAELHEPFYLVWDDAGDLYIGENFRISRVDASTGRVEVIAGTGEQGYAGDGGPADEAQIGLTRQLAFGPDDGLYFADERFDVVRRVDTDGTISTVVGTGAHQPAPDGTRAGEAPLQYPFGVAFDDEGRLHISELVNHLVRKVTEEGMLETVAGTIVEGRGVGGESGDGGPATQAHLHTPEGLAFDEDGNLYIGGPTIRMVDREGTIHTVIDVAEDLALSEGVPLTLSVDGEGGLYLSGEHTDAVYHWAGDGPPEIVVDGGGVMAPRYAAEGPDGHLYFTDDTTEGVYRLRTKA